MAIKRTKLDKVISKVIREAADWTCERCKKYFPEGPPRVGLHNSHYYGRGGKSVRYAPDNCDSLCYGCHKYMERSRDEYTAFKRKKLGETRFDELVLRANKPRKYTKPELEEMYQHYKAQLAYLERRRRDGEKGWLPIVAFD